MVYAHRPRTLAYHSIPFISHNSMSTGNQLAVVPAADYSVEFRSYNDDAWYTVAVFLEGETLRIKYSDFSEEQDNLFEPTDFQTSKQLDEFKDRFRPLSKQLQDNECRQLVQGVKVCACHSFNNDDVRFYDAVVDGVQENKHSIEKGEELCSCAFILFWLHGPNAGNLTASRIENICIVQPALEPDLVVGSFLKIAREKTEYISCHSISMSNGFSGREMVAYRNEDSDTACRLDFFEQLRKENRCARQSVGKVCSSEGLLLSNSRGQY